MHLMWIIFSGTEESPVISRVCHNKHELDSIQLKDDEWIEEFEVYRKIYTNKCNRSK